MRARKGLGALALSAWLALSGCSGIEGLTPKPLTPLKEGSTNTLTCIDRDGKRKTVYDLNGKWKAEYSDDVATYEVTINQDCIIFIGIKTKGGTYVREGSQTVRGILEKSGFKEVQVYDSDTGWYYKDGVILDDGNSIHLWGYSTNRLYRYK